MSSGREIRAARPPFRGGRLQPLARAACIPLLLAGAIALGCGGGRHAGGGGGDAASDCLDEDRDGRGTGAACSADDCDDTNPEVWEQDDCAALCASEPHSTGCPCDPTGSRGPEACYVGPDGTSGVGACHAGLRRCVADGVWSPCEDQLLPIDEACDEADNDCDGEIDEGVQNECGICAPCEQDCAGPGEGCEDWEDNEITAGISETAEGWLVLEGAASSRHVIWPSSGGEGSAFRVSTETLEIEAAFWTGPNHGGGDWGFSGGDSPSRSAVDDAGNLLIANRAIGLQGSITKIAADPATCPDRNGNGVIDTSRSWDDKLAFDRHDGWDDECILWHTEVGGPDGGIPRAMVIHPEAGLDGAVVEHGWVGLFQEERFLQFDTSTGELTGVEAPTPGILPYGSAVDREGWIWCTYAAGMVGHFDTADPANTFEHVFVAGDAYRVIVDENDRPWFSGLDDIHRYDRDDGTFTAVGIQNVAGRPFCCGNIASDGQGSIWAGTYASDPFVYRIDNDEGMEYRTIDTPGTKTFGVAVDFDGQVWAFGVNDQQTGLGDATVIDVATEETTKALDDCGGEDCLSWVYVRGDITGLQRRNALDPAGRWIRAFQGCLPSGGDGAAGTDWTRVLVDADTPAGSGIVVSVRTADELDGLRLAPWVEVGTVPDDGTVLGLDGPLSAAGVEDAAFLEVDVILRSHDHATTPVLRGLTVQWGCPGTII